MDSMRRTTAEALLGLAGLVMAGLPMAGDRASATEAPAREGVGEGALQLVLDSSGSMADADPAGGSKIAAAQAALGGVVDTLPEGVELGVRAYGGRYEDKDRGCTDTRLVLPMGALDRAAARTAFADLEPVGYTPIAASLQAAAADFDNDGPRRILLVSDGEETCGGDPCDVARELEQSGVDVVVDTVGYAADAATRTQLTCIAEATGGTYSEAADGPALATELAQVSQRAFEGYTPDGIPVTGGPSAAEAVVVEPGQYVDELDPDERTYYRLDLPNGVTPYIVATLARPDGVKGDGITSDQVEVSLLDSNLEDCEFEGGGEVNVRVLHVATTVLTTEPVGSDPASSDLCGRAGPAFVELHRNPRTVEGTAALPVELLVLFEPGVRDPNSLPPALTAPPEPLPAPLVPSTAPPVPGGGTFASAPAITSGTVSDGIRQAETRFYRIPVGWGQRAAFTAQFDVVPGAEAGNTQLEIRMYDPVRRRVGFDTYTTATSIYQLRSGAENRVSGSTPDIRYRNRLSNDSDISASSLAGDHWVAVTLGYDESLGDTIVPFRMRVEVTGEQTGAPDYVTQPAAVPGATPAPSSAPSAPEVQPTSMPSDSATASAGSVEPSSASDASPSARSTVAAGQVEPADDGTDWETVGYYTGGSAAVLAALALVLVPLLRGRT